MCIDYIEINNDLLNLLKTTNLLIYRGLWVIKVCQESSMRAAVGIARQDIEPLPAPARRIEMRSS